jgi:hypothetical protein
MQLDIAAVCCHFNPCHYQARVRNYRLFRENVVRSGIELLTVELAFGDDEFELGDAPNTLQLRGADVMWQKERLLNIGLAELVRRGYAKLVWLDADILFPEPDDWAQRVSAALDEHPLVQVFEKAVYCDELGCRVLRQLGCAAHYRLAGQWNAWAGARGFGWGLRSDVFQTVPLYDAAIIGGGDSLMHIASHGTAGAEAIGNTPYLQAFPPSLTAHWLSWAERWGAALRGDIGFVPQAIQVLHHGDWQDRGYLSRFEVLKRHNFDPRVDIACDPDTCWRWATSKPDLHRDVVDYFRSRREDGAVVHSPWLHQTAPQTRGGPRR